MAELIKVFRSLINDYKETFRVMKNGTIKVNNENFERYIGMYLLLIKLC